MRSLRKTAVYAALVFLAMFLSIIPANAASAKASLSKKKLTLYAGRSYSLKAKGFSGKIAWKSSNKKVAGVSGMGKVKARKRGTAVITATSGKVQKTCTVTVLPVKLNKTKITVKKGKTFRLTLKCGASKGIKWKTSKKTVVKIQSRSKNYAKLKAVKTGKATITAVYKKKKYKCKVTVSSKETPAAITEVTITTGSASKTYDGKPLKNSEVKAVGFPEGKAPVITATGAVTDVGTSENTYSIDWGNLDPKNYKITENLGTLEVVPATLTVTTDSASKPFDGTVLQKKDGASLTGLISGETAELVVTGSQTEVGWSMNGYYINWGTAKKTNYELVEKLGKLTVTPVPIEDTRDIVIDAGGFSGIYGRYYTARDIKLYMNGEGTPYPCDRMALSGDTITAVYLFSDGSELTVKVQGGGSEVGQHKLACSHSPIDDIPWIRSIKFVNTEIRIAGFTFDTHYNTLIYTHSDGSVTTHKLLNAAAAIEMYQLCCEMEDPIDPDYVLDEMIRVGYVV